MGQIFISHNHNDDPFVSKLAQDLTEYGLKTFVDHVDIKFGKDWTNKVQQALDDCDQMIAVISDQSRDSRNCTDEWAYFIQEKKEVIPVLLTGMMYFRFATINYVDFRTDYPHPLQQLIAVLTDDVNSSAGLYEESKLNLPTHRREKENTTLKAQLSLRYPLLRLPTRSIGIATGNIAEIMGADVLVNSENPELSMADINGGSVSSALNFYSAKWDDNGNLIEETIPQDLIAARRHLPEQVSLATVLATAATGSLKLIGVRYVIHTATVLGNRQTGYKTL